MARKISWQNYQFVWQKCITPWTGITNPSGKVSFEVRPGDYLVLTEYDPDRYDAGDKDKPGNEVYVGGSADGLKSGQIRQKLLHVQIKENGKKLSKGDRKAKK